MKTAHERRLPPKLPTKGHISIKYTGIRFIDMAQKNNIVCRTYVEAKTLM